MTRPGSVTFLGTGTSSGVPVIGCDCVVCRSTDPRDARLRPSIYVDVPERAHILVDTGSDLRQQALMHRITHLDAVLITHGHADHVLGLDEIRRYNWMQGGAIPFYANEAAWETIRKVFYYVFDGKVRQGGGIPRVEAHDVTGPFEVSGVRVVPIPLFHGRMPILGYRFGNFAYLTDCNVIPDASWPLLEGLDTLVLDALRDRPHSTHFTVAEAVDAARRLAPRQTFLTHMSHELGHAETNARLPPGVALAYDGLVVDFEADVVEADVMKAAAVKADAS